MQNIRVIYHSKFFISVFKNNFLEQTVDSVCNSLLTFLQLFSGTHWILRQTDDRRCCGRISWRSAERDARGTWAQSAECRRPPRNWCTPRHFTNNSHNHHEGPCQGHMGFCVLSMHDIGANRGQYLALSKAWQSCCTTCCLINPQQIKVMEFELITTHYNKPSRERMLWWY